METRPQARSTQSVPRPWHRIRGVIIACAITVVTMGRAATAASPPPLDLDTFLTSAACRNAVGSSGITLSAEVARGLIAFNTPYLFGGRALRTDLTCGACHGPSAPSGAAALLHFPVPVPDLARASVHGTDVAAFVSHAVITEFSGPPAPVGVARSLAVLAEALAPRAAFGISGTCHIGAAQLVDIGLRLSLDELRQAAPDAADFTIDSTRFVLGQMYQAAGPGQPNGALILSANGMLHDSVVAIEDGRSGEAALRLSRVATEWEAVLLSRQEPRIVIAAEGP